MLDYLFILGIIAILSGSKTLRIYLKQRKEREVLAHQEKIAMISRGIDPSAQMNNQVKQLVEMTSALQKRIENIETIVTTTDFELNKRLQQLMEREKEESFKKLEQVSQAITGEFVPLSTFSNRYKVLRELGRGGMGIVLQAEDLQLKEMVALKIITPQISSDPQVLERFKQEAATSRKISHPNVIRIHDLGEFEGTLYISMEFFQGKSLKEILRQDGKLKVERVLDYMRKISQGMAAAHELGIIHRDLKPHNILVNGEEQLKIIDFGLAKASYLKGLTMTGLVVGTPEYMSPEQISGKEIDVRSDIYSFGVIVFEMLTGSLPFIGETPISIGFKHLSEAPEFPAELQSTIPKWLREVTMKMLAKEKEERYESVGHIIKDLEAECAPEKSALESRLIN